jgi:hypothetical protein
MQALSQDGHQTDYLGANFKDICIPIRSSKREFYLNHSLQPFHHGNRALMIGLSLKSSRSIDIEVNLYSSFEETC